MFPFFKNKNIHFLQNGDFLSVKMSEETCTKQSKKTFTFQTFKTWSFHEDFFVETDAQGHISSQVCRHNLEHIVNKSRFRWGSGVGISKYGELCSFSASLG